jgi:acyl-CoA reductase-like NAD-dependent aldehyde dehydrogenase
VNVPLGSDGMTQISGLEDDETTISACVERARQAALTFREIPLEERIALLRKAAKLMLERRQTAGRVSSERPLRGAHTSIP